MRGHDNRESGQRIPPITISIPDSEKPYVGTAALGRPRSAARLPPHSDFRRVPCAPS